MNLIFITLFSQSFAASIALSSNMPNILHKSYGEIFNWFISTNTLILNLILYSFAFLNLLFINWYTAGLGLWKVKQIIKKNKNLNINTTRGDLFRQELEIY